MSKRRRARPASVAPHSSRQGGRRPPAAPSRRLSPRLVLVAGSVTAAILLVAFVFLGAATQRAYACDAQLAPAVASGPDGQATKNLGNQHVAVGAALEYAYCPPASGDHFAERGRGPLPARFYPPTSEASPGGWIHNLEHGYVVVLYSCGDSGSACPSEAELEALRAFQANAPPTASAQACGIPSKVLAVRFDSMKSRFAFLAWNRVALADIFDRSAARAFAQRWIDQAPEAGAC